MGDKQYYIGGAYYSQAEYITFALGSDFLNQFFNANMIPTDIWFTFCRMLADMFMMSDDYNNLDISLYEAIEKWAHDNEDFIIKEYYNFTNEKENNTMENTTLNTTENTVEINLKEQPKAELVVKDDGLDDDGFFKHTPEGLFNAMRYFLDLSDDEKDDASFECYSLEGVLRDWDADDFIDRCNEWQEADEYDVIINITLTKTIQKKALDGYAAMERIRDEFDQYNDFDCPYDWDVDNVEFDYL